MALMSGADAILQQLLENDVATIFGLPGGQLDHFFDAMYRSSDRVRFIGSRHEQGAGYMAFGYARSTGRPGVYTVVPGPGVLNTAAALCTAYATNAPVLCLTGQIPSEGLGRGIGYLHELPDQLATLRSITRWAERIHDARRGARDRQRGVRAAQRRPARARVARDADGPHGANGLGRIAAACDAARCALGGYRPHLASRRGGSRGRNAPKIVFGTGASQCRRKSSPNFAFSAVRGLSFNFLGRPGRDFWNRDYPFPRGFRAGLTNFEKMR